MGISKAFTCWITDYDNPLSYGSKLRAKRVAPLMAMIETIYKAKGRVRVIDLGGTETYWNILPKPYLRAHRVTITLVNLCGSETVCDREIFQFMEADACDLAELKDKSFDIAHSNSVVEHVGDWQKMLKFSQEISRVANNYFVQTPNFWFPMEPHCMTPFFHWLPEPVKVWLVQHLQLGHWQKAQSTSHAVEIVQSARLLNKSMFQALFSDASINTETLLLMPKSYIAIKHATTI